MNALVSGRAGLAVVVDGKRVSSLHVDAPDTLVRRSSRDLRHLLGESRDVEVLERVDLDAIRARLLCAQREAEALDMIVGVLDAELTHETRCLCLEAAEELFAESEVAEAVAAVLCACPQPEGVELEATAELCVQAGGKRSAALLREVAARQAEIEVVAEAWLRLPSRFFGDEAARARVRAAFVQAGLFRDLVRALAAGKHLGGMITAALLRPELRVVPGYRDILQGWASALSQRTGVPGAVSKFSIHEKLTPQEDIMYALRHQDERETLLMVREAAPGDTWTWVQHGDALRQMGRLEEALHAYEQALSSGDDVDAKTGRAEVLKAMEQREKTRDA